MKGKTKKSNLTERWVDVYILMNGHPPTYSEIGEHFNIKRTACYNRCSKFRDKMNQHKKKKTSINNEDIEKIIMDECAPVSENNNELNYITHESILLVASKIKYLMIKTQFS